MTSEAWAIGVRGAISEVLDRLGYCPLGAEEMAHMETALAAAGAKIVPVEATDAMFDACRCAVNAELIKRRFVDRQVRWAAMLSASPPLDAQP